MRVSRVRETLFKNQTRIYNEFCSSKRGDKLPKKCVKLTKTMNKIHNVDKVDIWFYNLFIL